MNKLLVALAFLCLIATTGCQNTEKTYADCVLNNIEKAQSEKAAMAISQSCAQKFPPKKETFTFEEATVKGR